MDTDCLRYVTTLCMGDDIFTVALLIFGMLIIMFLSSGKHFIIILIIDIDT